MSVHVWETVQNIGMVLYLFRYRTEEAEYVLTVNNNDGAGAGVAGVVVLHRLRE
jgi:hypothetical protein